MAHFNFTGLIKKYETTFTVISTSNGGYNDLGEWQPGTEEQTEMRGAIISLKEDKVYRSEGLLTSQDRELFMLEPLPGGLLGATVIYNGNKYKIQGTTDNSEFTGVSSYVLKFVSAFGGDSTA